MYKIVSKEQFSEKVFRLRVEAPLIAKAYRAGNFVIVRVAGYGVRLLFAAVFGNIPSGAGALTVAILATVSLYLLLSTCTFTSLSKLCIIFHFS